MYREGRGVPQSDRRAVEWFRRAAEQGLDAAQSNLGFMYKEGRGLTQDREEAYVYFYLAYLNGLAHARKQLNALENRGLLNMITSRGLSRAQIERSRRRAMEIHRT